MVDWKASSVYRTARRVVVGVVGGTVTLIGIALIVLPGPAFVVIPAGLSILALEFAFARRWMRQLAERAKRLRAGGGGSDSSSSSA